MNRLVLLLIILFFSGTAANSSVFATSNLHDHNENDTTLSVEKIWEMKRIGNPVISPDGKWVVAPVTRYTAEDDKAHTDLWLFNPEGTVERALTRHGSADGQPVFSPDGKHLAFVSRRDDDSAAQIYLLPINEPGEAVRLTDVPTGTSAPKWVGEHIYFVSFVYPGKSWDEMKKKLDANRASHLAAHTWNRLPFSSWDRWLDEERENHLYRVHVKNGNVEPITEPTGWELPRSSAGTGSYDVAPDESLVAFVTDTNRDDLDQKVDIYIVRPGSSNARNITEANAGVDSNPLFSPNGRYLAFTSQRIRGFYADTRRLNIYDVRNESSREVTTDWDRSADGLIWAPDNRGLYGTIDDAGTRRVYHIRIDGREPMPVTEATDFPSIAISNNGTLVALNHSFLYPPRIVTINPRNGQTNRIDTINDDVMEGIELGTYESVTYQGANGQDIQMWVHFPPGFDSSKKYPLILLIHGGPHSGITDGFHFRWNAQTFASWGYVTAWHNFHGSSGFGQDFTDSINPDWISKPYEDTMKAAEWFMNQSWIDSDRMVAGGASYGGYLSSVILGKEHPFNTLLIHAPVYNLYSQLAADFAVHTVRFGHYWEDPSLYKSLSPHYFAGNFDTPALLTHGQLDYRVPVGQIFELFRTLQSRNVDSRLIYFENENHWILRANNSIYWYNQVREWFGKYAEPGPK